MAEYANLSREDRLKLADMDPELAEVLRHTNIPPFEYDTPAEGVQKLRAMNAQYQQQPEADIAERDVFIKARDGFELRLHVYEAADDSNASRPLCVFWHGGGFTVGVPEGAGSLCRSAVRALGAVCVSPQYRLGPEHRFPAAFNDGWDAVQYIAAHAKSEFKADPSRGFILGGTSAGGRITATVSHLARDEKLSPPLTGTYFGASSFLSNLSPPEKYKDRLLSRTDPTCVNALILDKKTKQLFDESFAADQQSPLFAPFYWPNGHAGLPRAYFQVCGADISRDDGCLYEEVLREAGAKTRLDLYPGLPHVFWSYLPMLKATQKSRADVIQGLSWLLSEEDVEMRSE